MHWLPCLILLASLLGCAIFINENTYASTKECVKYQCKNPIVNDENLKLEIVYQGEDDQVDYKYNESKEENLLTSVTKMAFLGYNDILMLNKNDGKVARIVNHSLLPQPLIDLNVAYNWEQGLLGIEISRNASKIHVFLYYTESKTAADGGDICPTIYCAQPTQPIQNKLYRYDLENDKLVNPKLLFSAPALNVASHIGGALKIGPDNNLYIIIGDFHGYQENIPGTMSQNNKSGAFPDGRSGILRLTQDGKAVGSGILGKEYPLNLYYGYGIRNGYGLDFDPVSGKLWDTENGPNFGDEINLVEPGFNGGWNKVQGMSYLYHLYQSGKKFNPEDLWDFDGKGKYSDPKFVWNTTVAPTALSFLNSDKLGKRYENDLFVASFNLGVIYHYDLNENRMGLKLPPTLNMTTAQNEDLKELIFAQGLGKVTDMQVGPDGKLYILSKYYNKPTIFRISR